MKEKLNDAGHKEKSKKKMTHKPVKSEKKITDKIIKVKQPNIILPKCEISKHALVFDSSITLEEYIQVGNFLEQIKGSVHFWVGDLINFGAKKWGHGKYTEAERMFDYEHGTLLNDAYVARQIEPSRRRESLDFGHHYEVASLPPDEQDLWMDKAEKEHLTVKDLRAQIKKSKRRAESKNPKYKRDSKRRFCWVVKDKITGESVTFDKYVSLCKENMDILRALLEQLREFKKRFESEAVSRLAGSGYIEKTIEECEFIPSSIDLLKEFKVLWGEKIINLTSQEKTNAEDKKDIIKENDFFDDVVEPKDKPKIEEAKKEEVAPQDIQDLFED